MKTLLVIMLALFAAHFFHAPTDVFAEPSGSTSYAIPLQGITIDGKLDDWPKDMIFYPILNNGKFYGPTDIDDADLITSPDLSPGFMVGYDLAKNLIYIAVRVCDDSLRVSKQDPWHTDACEVYVDGSNTGRTLPAPVSNAAELPALQYVSCPPGGAYGPEITNPSIFGGDIAQTKTKIACSRNGDITIYEWAVEAFDHYPDSQTRLEAGKTIGFDVVVVDKDTETDTPAWICWGPVAGLKFINADKLGKLVFLESYNDLGMLAGTVTNHKTGKAYPGLSIDIMQGEKTVGSARTNEKGHFAFSLLPGEYSIGIQSGQGLEPVKKMAAKIEAGIETNGNFTVTPIKVPEVIERAASIYKTLKGYRDSTTVEERMVGPSMDNRTISRILFALKRPNRLKYENKAVFESAIVCDGIKLHTYLEMYKQFIQKDAPDVLLPSDLQVPMGGMLGSNIVHKIIMSDDPMKIFLKDVDEIKEIGSEELDGVPVTVIEKTQPIGSLGSGIATGTIDKDMPVKVQLWIGSNDSLIRKVAFELDMEELSKSMPAEQRAQFESVMKGMKIITTASHAAIEIDPVFSDTNFAFIPPEGAQLVEQFTPPSMPSQEKSQLIGKPAPDFVLKDLDGKETKLADFKGKVLIVDFWATWCGPCKAEIPGFIALQLQYASKGFSMIGISTDEKSDLVKTFAAENKMNYPILMADGKVKNDYGGIPAIPMTFVIDKKGIVRYQYTGVPSDTLIFQKNVEELLAE